MPQITRDNARAEQPKSFKVELMPHQLGLLKACSDYEDYNRFCRDTDAMGNRLHNIEEHFFRFGVICAKVGAGKSYVAMGLIKRDNQFKYQKEFKKSISISYFHSSVKHISYKTTDHNMNLIVVPSPTIGQWKQYAENAGAKALVIDNTKSMGSIKDFNMEKFQEYEAIIVTQKRFKEYAFLTDSLNIKYKRVFIDEADSIRIDGMKQYNFKCDFFWMITSSTRNMSLVRARHIWDQACERYRYDGGITSNLNVIRLIMSPFIEKKDFHAAFSFSCDPDFISDSIKMEPFKEMTIRCKNPVVIRTIQSVVEPSIINMINAGDIKGAIKSYGNINIMKEEEDLINAISKDLKQKLSLNKQRLDAIIMMPYQSETAKALAISKAEQNVKEVERKIKDLEEKMESNCPICYDEPKPLTITKCCKTKYCFECLVTSLNLNGKCPYCRAVVKKSDIMVQSDVTPYIEPAAAAKAIALPENELKDKFTEFKNLINKILSENPDSKKILVFSDFSNIFAQMKNYVRQKRIKTNEMKGVATSIEKKIGEFNNGKAPVIFLNSQYCGAGLNLEHATDIIIYHKLARDLKMQVIGRAQRYGRKGQLNVWNMLNENEITN